MAASTARRAWFRTRGSDRFTLPGDEAWRGDAGFPSTQSCGDLSPRCAKALPLSAAHARPSHHSQFAGFPVFPAPGARWATWGKPAQVSVCKRKATGRALHGVSPPSPPARGTATASPSLHRCPHRCRLMPCGRALPAPPAPRSLQKKTGSGSSPLPELRSWQRRHVGHGAYLHALLADELQRAYSVYFSLLDTQTRGTGRIMTSCVLLLMLN